MIVSIGSIVHYVMTEKDAEQVNRRRTTSKSIRERIANDRSSIKDECHWPIGAQAHIGEKVKEGDLFPMIVTRVFFICSDANLNGKELVNGQLFLDGNDQLWVIGVPEDTSEFLPTWGTWHWLPKV